MRRAGLEKRERRSLVGREKRGSLKWTRGRVPAALQSFTSSPSKADTSLRRTVGAGPERVCLRGS